MGMSTKKVKNLCKMKELNGGIAFSRQCHRISRKLGANDLKIQEIDRIKNHQNDGFRKKKAQQSRAVGLLLKKIRNRWIFKTYCT